ncbi:MAG: hypothetical protein CMJ84_10400 [Planctomycetes bacterium]|jgi:hypothetical protein|nr:hypothetical protein [Planctomycetota bacterium]MDP6409389.1 hypothetical protein [Planctomycetota bacterium]
MKRYSASAAAKQMAAAHILLALLAGLAVRVGSFEAAADFYGMYAPGARDLLEGRAYPYTRSGPGYSALLALMQLCGLEAFGAAKLIAAIGTTAVGYFAFRLALPIVGGVAGLLTQVLTYVVLFRFSFVAGNDIPCAALSLASLVCLLSSLQGGSERRYPRRLFLAGLLGAAAFATRYSAASVLVVSVSALAIFLPRAVSGRVRVANMARYAIGAGLVIVPWFAANQAWHGALLHNRTHALIALEVFGGEGDQVNQIRLKEMEERFDSLTDVVAQDPGRIAVHYLFDFYEDCGQLLADSLPLPAYLFMGGGLLWVFLHGKRRRSAIFLLAYVVAAFSLVALAPYQARYHYPVVPVLNLFVAAGLVGRWTDHEGPGTVPHRVRIAATAVVLFVIGSGSAIKTAEYLADDPVEVLPAAEVLRELALPGDAVACRKGHVAYLGRMKMQPLPVRLDLGGFLDWLEQVSGAGYVYVGPLEVRTNAALAPLARCRFDADRLELLHRREEPAACLYRVLAK